MAMLTIEAQTYNGMLKCNLYLSFSLNKNAAEIYLEGKIKNAGIFLFLVSSTSEICNQHSGLLLLPIQV